MFKKQLLLLSSFIIGSSALTAYANNAPMKGELDTGGGFEVSIAALWLQPAASNLNYVILNNELPTLSPRWVEQEVKPSLTPAFELGLRYIFPNSSNKDINLNWTHLSTDNSDTTNADNVKFFLGPDYEIGPAGIPIRHAKGKAEFNYDLINLNVGQWSDLARDVHVRLFGGVSAGLLHENVDATFSGTDLVDAGGDFKLHQEVVSRFNGIGPNIGVHVNYDGIYGFGLLGEASLSALIGDIHAKTSYAATSVIDTAEGLHPNRQTIKDEHATQVIPGMDFKLGVDYKYALNQALLTVSAGYQAAIYINAISQYLPGTLVTPLETGGIYVATMDHTLSNYSVQGPFFNVAVKF